MLLRNTHNQIRLSVIQSCFLCSCRHQNLIAQAQSGTGKTAAFSLAMLSYVNPADKWTQVGSSCSASRHPLRSTHRLKTVFQCLCVAPTYELALQIGQVIEQMGKFCVDVKVAYAVRGNRSKNMTGL